MLETTIDKFIFRIQEDLYYNETGVWVAVEGYAPEWGFPILPSS